MIEKKKYGRAYHVCPHCGRKKGYPFFYHMGERPGIRAALKNILQRINEKR